MRLALLLLFLLPLRVFASGTFPDQGAAYAQCQADMAALQSMGSGGGYPYYSAHPSDKKCNHIVINAQAGTGRYECSLNIRTGAYAAGFWGCDLDAGGETTSTYSYSASCAVRPMETGWYTDDDPNTSNDVCNNGCYMAATLNLDTQQTEWYPTGSTCSDADAPPPVSDRDGDGVPDDQDAFPDDPNESADSDGDGIGDNADAQPDDGTDGSDDGEGNESDNQASGGGTCKAPPTCSGDGIACNTLIQQWRTRCAIEGYGQKVENAACDSPLDLKCTGLTIQQCYDLAFQKKQACAAGGEGGDDDQPEWTKVQGDGSGIGGEDPDPSSVVREGIGLNPENVLDDGGFWGGSASCPTLGTLNLPLYGSFNLDQFDFLCDLLAAIRAFLLLLGAFMALRILMGG